MRALESLDRCGYAVAAGVLQPHETADIGRALDEMRIDGAGTRNLLGLQWCRALVRDVGIRLGSSGLLPRSLRAVQCTLFDKTPGRNWLVALHQDVSIPVRGRVGHPSLRGWSTKEGTLFVHAPVEVLERLIAVRLHIDDCGVENGPLKVVPGSHRAGRLDDSAARALRDALGEDTCLARSGDALLMRPLVLHASSKAIAPSRRRVLHILFGPPALPHGLEWPLHDTEDFHHARDEA